MSHPDQHNLWLSNGTIPLSPPSLKRELLLLLLFLICPSRSHKLDQLLDMTEVLMYLFSVRPESSSDSPSDCTITRSDPRQESGIQTEKEEKGQLTEDSLQIVRLDKV